MFFSPNALGIEICRDGARFALVGGKSVAPKLEAFTAISFPPDILGFSMREENITNQDLFVAGIRDAYLKMLTKTTRISVSLPDGAGRVVLLDLDTRFKSRDEGADIIRWKMKKSFPFDVNELHLDYQILQEKESGEISALVSLVSRKIIRQYEDCLAAAGLQVNYIDFSTFNICRLFSSRLDVTDNAVLLVNHESTLSVLIFNNGLLQFYRSKELPGDSSSANRVYREISSSLQFYKDRHSGFSVNEVLCIDSNGDAEMFRSVAAEATGLEPVFLDAGRVVSRASDVVLDGRTIKSMAAAVGAAIRNL
jgi:type IV pilus assembly protein PilM